MTEMPDVGSFVQYVTDTNHPPSQVVAGVLDGLIEWIDGRYTDGQIMQKIASCGMREVVKVEYNDPPVGPDDHTVLYVHRAHLGCNSDQDLFATHVPTDKVAHFSVRRKNVTFSSGLHVEEVDDSQNVLVAKSNLKFGDLHGTHDDIELVGGMTCSISNEQVFPSVGMVEHYIDVIKDLISGAIDRIEAANILICQPEWHADAEAPVFLQFEGPQPRPADPSDYVRYMRPSDSQEIYSLLSDFCDWFDNWYGTDLPEYRIQECLMRQVDYHLPAVHGFSDYDEIYLHGKYMGCDEDPDDPSAHLFGTALARFGFGRLNANISSSLGQLENSDGSPILGALTTFRYESRQSLFNLSASIARPFRSVEEFKDYLDIFKLIAQYDMHPITAGELLISTPTWNSGGLAPMLMKAAENNSVEAALSSVSTAVD